MESDVSSSDTGAHTPLMNKDYSSYEDESLLEKHSGYPSQKKPSDWRAAAIILGFECLESTAFYGIATNLVVYLQKVLHGSSAASTANVSTWSGTAYFTPLVGALVADAYLGNYRMILLALAVYLLGMLMIVLSAITESCIVSACTSTGAHNLIFFSGLYLVAVGSGGVKSALLPFGADQFDDEDSDERERKSSFFSMFYVCITFGSLISGILIVWVQENVNWTVGFGVSALCMALAFAAFVAGTPTYRLRTPRGRSPLQGVVQVLIAAYRKTTSSEAATNCHDPEAELCAATRVEEVKKLGRLLPIWATGVVYSAAYSQIGTSFIQQGAAMDNKVGSFSVSPASFSSFEVLCVAAWVLVYNRILAPLIAGGHSANQTALSLLQRMGIGHCLMIAAMAVAACLESRRLQSAKLGDPLWILWQAPQYFVIAGSEAFCYVAQLEFFYDQAPEAMKSMCTAMSLLTISVGNYLSSLVVTLVALVTGAGGAPGWLPDDLIEGHLDYYYWMLSGLCALNFALYVTCARSYKLKNLL